MPRFRSALNKKNIEPDSKYQPYQKEPRAMPRWTQMVDMFSKLIAACAVLAATFVANEYQSSMTTVSLLAKREEAESSLRAGMFRDLIKPITGSDKLVIPVEREQLMTELLALNFHEHFELKPLMLRVDERLGAELKGEERLVARNSLRSVARRVVQRQIALLTKEDSTLDAGDRSCIYELELGGSDSENSLGDNHRCLQTVKGDFGELITLNSPNQVYNMSVTVSEPGKDKNKWEEEKFKVAITINHVCLNTVEALSNVEKTNALSEIYMISALRKGNDPFFTDDNNFYTGVKEASNYLWDSSHNSFEPKSLRANATARWVRIQEYNEKLADKEIDDYPLPTSEKHELINPEMIQKLPEHISCKVSKNNEKYLNSNYSLKVDSDFTLTPYDFPFTDNTLLADGTRFSIVLDKVYTEDNRARFKIIWFPKDYIAARERPVNFSEIRNKLGITFVN